MALGYLELESVTTGIQGNAILVLTLVLLKCRYQHTKAVGSLENWDLTLLTDCRHKIEYRCFKLSLYCGAFLAKSFDGNGSEAQRIRFCI